MHPRSHKSINISRTYFSGRLVLWSKSKRSLQADLWFNGHFAAWLPTEWEINTSYLCHFIIIHSWEQTNQLTYMASTKCGILSTYTDVCSTVYSVLSRVLWTKSQACYSHPSKMPVIFNKLHVLEHFFANCYCTW